MATATLKDHLRDLREGRPGHRFQDHYRHEKKDNRARHSRGRMWRLILGVVAIIVGIVLCVIPGPGLPFIFLGGGLLAAESLIAARVMDWLELRVRVLWRWAHGYWEKLPLWGKIIVGTLIVAGGVASSIFFYRLMRG